MGAKLAVVPPIGLIDIHSCSACGNNHEHVAYYEPSNGDMQYWCVCPNNGKTILLEGLTQSVRSPVRFQLKRTRGWRKPANSISVARPTIWGNPFVVRGPYPGTATPFRVYSSNRWDVGVIYETATKKEAHQKAVELFSKWFDKSIAEPGNELYEFRMKYGWHGFQLACVCHSLLHGKSLGCWCTIDMPCHADPILKLANPGLILP